MKKFYPSTLCAIVLSSLLGFSFSASAQTYAHTYKTTPVLAIGASDWSAQGSDVPIWDGTTGQPPSTCSNCLIQLIGPGVIHLNTSVILTNNSSLVVGPNVTLEIDNSNTSGFPTGYNILMDATATDNNTLVLTNNTSVLDATATGTYDGVLTSYPDGANTDYIKQFGNGGLYFQNNAVMESTAAVHGDSATGTVASPVTLSSSSGDLPIILASFNAALDQGAVDLSWTTAMEANSDHFSVQRSTNAGASWDEIGTVAAAGNSSKPLNYSFVDNKPAQGTSEYRLQLIDRDGKYAYSDVKAVQQGIVTGVNIYPNPAHDYVNITLSGTAGESMLIRLFNSGGQLLQEKNVANAGGTTVPIAVSSYPEGNYLIVVSGADGSRQISKLLITK